jgi:DNA-binding transcriptional LysR family regulator
MANDSYKVMDLKALRCLWATGRHSSLTKAGIELGISEAAVSQRIKSLQQHLGVKLYESRGGKVRLTPAGEHTLGMAIRLFDELKDFEAAVAEDAAAGTLTLSTHEPVLRYFLPDIVKQFTEGCPLARLQLLSRPFKETNRLVQSNEADLGIITEHRLSEDLVFHPICTYKAYLLIPKSHALMRRGQPAMQDLLTEEIVSRYPLIVAETDDPEHDPIRSVLQDRGLPYNVRLEAGTEETVKHYVAQGYGLAVVSGMCLTEEDSRVFTALQIPDDLWKGTTYGVIRRADKYLTQALSDLLSLLGIPMDRAPTNNAAR